MQTAVVINLDYEILSADRGQKIWRELEKRMLAAGFARDYRVFKMDAPPAVAFPRARAVLSEFEPFLKQQGLAMFDVVREFYGFEMENCTNLLEPAQSGIEVQVIEDWLPV
ncbi:hypothetical protein [Parachitinimonas caeni]|uniref:Uncharacterized protein n=1 Tax=Parachitinimonas caeni TaxID=3031301 RepID=A0ABT7DU74_9NEIS|nr:hypothetical protein [Parachitinimonas caeni]MDK2123632.1 hypothetical protein [Parachitinimonas caeni]